MSVSLGLYKGETPGEIIMLFCTPVSFEKYYYKVWDKANKELGIELFKTFARPICFDDVPQVIDELTRLKEWAQVNADDYMTGRIENLLKIIPELHEKYSSREDASEIYFDVG